MLNNQKINPVDFKLFDAKFWDKTYIFIMTKEINK